MVAVAMIVVLVLVLIVVVVQIAQDGSAGPRVAEPIAGTGTTPVRGLTAPPSPALAWTGDDLFVFGGTDRSNVGPGRVSNSGARVDVMSGDATALPESPFHAPLLSPAAVRAGNTIVVMGVECPDYGEPDDSPSNTCAADGVGFAVAAYDLGRGEWAAIAPPDNLGSIVDGRPVDPATGNPFVSWAPQIVGVTDQGAVVVTLDRTGGDIPDYWALTPGTKWWQHLGTSGPAFTACVLGDRLVVSSAATRDAKNDWTDATLRSLDTTAPDRGWQTDASITGAHYPSFGGARIVCMGTRVMVTGALGEANGGFRVYDTRTHALSTPPAPPAPGGAIGARIWSGTEVLFINFMPRISGGSVDHSGALLPGYAFNPTTNTWRTIPGFPVLPVHPIWGDTAVVDYAMPEQPIPQAVTVGPGSPPGSSAPPKEPASVDPIVVRYTP